jgi:hypothetical protein
MVPEGRSSGWRRVTIEARALAQGRLMALSQWTTTSARGQGRSLLLTGTTGGRLLGA